MGSPVQRATCAFAFVRLARDNVRTASVSPVGAAASRPKTQK
jgi:hypothetical protein